MEADWFKSWINAVIAAHGDNESRVADLLGHKGTSQVHRWALGQEPLLYKAADAFGKLGGDIRRALPDWEPDHALTRPAGFIIGAVAAGTARFAAAEEPREVTVAPDSFLRSPWFAYTRAPESGRRIEWVQVSGDSMEPDYPNGSLLACRPPSNPRELPDGAHVILRTAAGDMTFKMAQFKGTGKHRQIIAIPLNRRHDVQFFDAAEVTIDWVCLGMIQLSILDGPSPGLLRDGMPGEIPAPEVVI